MYEVNKGLGARRSSFFYFIPLPPPSQTVVEITQKETEATDFRFSILIFGEQINDLSP